MYAWPAAGTGTEHPGGKVSLESSLSAFDPVGAERSDRRAGAHLSTNLWETEPPGSLECG